MLSHAKQPDESFYDGLEITELLMTAYMSAEQERTILFRTEGLETYVPSSRAGCGSLRHDIVSTTLPKVSLDSRRRWASWICSSGKTESITGSIVPWASKG